VTVNSTLLVGGVIQRQGDWIVNVYSIPGSREPFISVKRLRTGSAQRILLRRKTRVIGTGQRLASHFLLEWSPCNGKWYPINYRNVEPKSMDNRDFLERYREAMNRVLAGETVSLEAEYLPERKLLLITEIRET